MQKILLISIILLLPLSAVAYNSPFLEQISNDMNKTLPKPHDQYTTWESTFFHREL